MHACMVHGEHDGVAGEEGRELDEMRGMTENIVGREGRKVRLSCSVAAAEPERPEVRYSGDSSGTRSLSHRQVTVTTVTR